MSEKVTQENKNLSSNNMPSPMLFFSMGMFILDDIIYPDGRRETGKIGGAGTYATVGAGLVSTRQERPRMGFVVDKGSDFPVECEQQLKQYNLGILWRDTPERKTTRALNVFGLMQERYFEYLTPKLQVTPQELPRSKVFHIICAPDRCEEFTKNISADAISVWEPVETSCKAEQWGHVKRVWNSVQIFSPNLLEAGLFVGLNFESGNPEQLLMDHYNDFQGWLVLRCGARGSLLRSPSRQFKWYPAYHSNQENVKDPAGGGNSFLGGLGAALAENPTDWDLAMAKASVASSFIIEQTGLPVYDATNNLWNGCDVSQRLEEYLKHISEQ